MKKFLSLVLSLLFVAPVFAGSVSDIDKDAYIKHTREMQSLRRQILDLTVKSNKTEKDEAALKKLSAVFDEKSAQWQSYLERVAEEGSEASLPEQGFKRNMRRSKDENSKRMEGEMRAKMGRMKGPEANCQNCCGTNCQECCKDDCKACCEKPMLKHGKKNAHKHICSVCGKSYAEIAKMRKARKMAKMRQRPMPPMRPCMCDMPKDAKPPMAPCCKDGKPKMPPPCCKDGKAPMAPAKCQKCEELNASKICEKCHGMKLDLCDKCKGVKAPNFCDKCKADMTRPVPPMPLMPPMRPCFCNMPKGVNPQMAPCCKSGKPMIHPPCCKNGKAPMAPICCKEAPKFDHKAACAACCGAKNVSCAECCKGDCKSCCDKKALESCKKEAKACCKEEAKKACCKAQ